MWLNKISQRQPQRKHKGDEERIENMFLFSENTQCRILNVQYPNSSFLLGIGYWLLIIGNLFFFYEISKAEKNIWVGKTTLRFSVSSLRPLWLYKKVNHKESTKRMKRGLRFLPLFSEIFNVKYPTFKPEGIFGIASENKGI
ncbi:hypothetical protein D1164_17365 [Mariniphaga sediminis]|uniref:Uncharacterized protein n=1 Tax=Mariniphaga sediminis TaxID=1628158 RepID=A0A399CX10_9BACT|nr:hypothetical protein D1164_17365 [Mariniphaga sediminis]